MLKIKKPTQLTKQRPKVYCKRYLPLVESSVMMMYSVGGVGKSFAAMRQAIEFVLDTGKRAALWLTEDPEGENRDRYERLLKQYAATPREFFDSRIDFIADSPCKLTKLRDGNAILTDEFWQVRLDLFDYSLVVLDPLLQFQGCDENSNTHAGVLMGALKDWAGEEQKVIFLLHHASVNQGTLRLKPRGAGEWTNGTRGAYEISRVLSSDGKSVNETRKDFRTFTLTKDNGLSFYFRDDITGLNERELPVFPPYEKHTMEDHQQGTNRVRLSVADHNSEKNSKGFEVVEVDFDSLHNVVRENKCYSPYMFAGGHRLNDNNLGVSDVLCLDFD